MPEPTPVLKPLSPRQERRLMEYMEERFLEINRQHKKRSHPTSSLPTLISYLEATRTLISLILQVPPTPPSITLRTALLLRLTNDTLLAIPGYLPESDVLQDLLAWLDDLDCAWVTVLLGRIWVPPEPGAPQDSNRDLANGDNVGKENGLDEDLLDEFDGDDDDDSAEIDRRALTPTDRARLRSLLVGGEDRFEEWLSNLRVPGESKTDMQDVLESLGVQQRFDSLFSGTMRLIGGLEGLQVISVTEPGMSCAAPP